MIVFLDLETRALAQDVGGWLALKAGAGGISVAITIAEPGHIVRVWDDHTVEALAAYLESADTVVTWNGFRFDLRVIEGVLGRALLLREHIDLKLERRAKGLDDEAQKILGRGKTGHGEEAPGLAAEGRWGELVQYCIDDVELTRDLYYATLEDSTNGQNEEESAGHSEPGL